LSVISLSCSFLFANVVCCSEFVFCSLISPQSLHVHPTQTFAEACIIYWTHVLYLQYHHVANVYVMYVNELFTFSELSCDWLLS